MRMLMASIRAHQCADPPHLIIIWRPSGAEGSRSVFLGFCACDKKSIQKLTYSCFASYLHFFFFFEQASRDLVYNYHRL